MTRSEWLAFRRTGLGSSDAPVIMGVSPWKTPLELWKEKTGRVKDDVMPSFVQSHGINMEPRARAAYELLNDLDMPPKVFRHPVYSHLIASLDGWNEERRRILEIKCPLQPGDHELAKSGTIPEKYVWQLRHQLMVTEAEVAYYFSYFKPKEEIPEHYVLLHLERDIEAELPLFEACREFWRLVESDTPPPLTERDYKEVSEPECIALFERWKAAKQAGKKTEVATLRAEIQARMDHPRLRCAGVDAVLVSRSTGKVVELRWKEPV